jgi:hypothetical protein
LDLGVEARVEAGVFKDAVEEVLGRWALAVKGAEVSAVLVFDIGHFIHGLDFHLEFWK